MKRLFLIIFIVFILFIPSLVNAEDTGMINGDFVTIRTAPGGTKITSLLYGTEVTVIETTTKSNTDYYKIIYDGINTGYVSTSYVWLYSDITLNDEEYCEVLKAKGFPESYCPYLSYLHSIHPTWEFDALITNLKFADVVDSEEGKNYIQSTNDSYRASDKLMEAGGWYTANQTVNSYFLDPRNFLMEKTIFMFENLTYDEESQTRETIASIFGSDSYLTTALDEENVSYIDYYLDAGKTYSISPVHLAARTKQEGGSSSTYAAVSGTYDKQYNGLSVLGYYNYYNIGAYADSITTSPVLRGLAYAACYVSKGSCNKYSRPWNTRKKAIYGGAQFLANSYITAGQYTLYLEKFNTNPNAKNSLYTHQYMTNILAPYSEAVSLGKSYKNNNLYDVPFKFVIPVYLEMPEKSSIPTLLSSVNSLSSITINDKELTTFDQDITSYNMYLINDVKTIKIEAVASSSDSTVEGVGEFPLTEGDNTFTIKVTAENGDINEYVINVKVVSDTTTVNDIISKLSVKVKDKNLYGIGTNTAVTTILSSIEKISPNATKIILDSNGKEKTTGIITTGDKLILSTYISEETTYTLIVNGDINGDGNVTIQDLLKIQKHILGTNTLNDIYYIAADNNYDGKITVQDLLRIQKHILGSITL